MFTFIVTRTATGEEVYRYDAEAPIPWNEFPFSEYTHTETPYVDPNTPPQPTLPPHVRLTKLEFLRRFTLNERILMRAAAQQSPQMYDYMAMLEMAEEVFLDDPDTIAGVTYLEQLGLLATGRATEILNV